MVILICDAFDKSLPDRLKKFGEVTDDVARLPEAEVALVRSKTKCTARVDRRRPEAEADHPGRRGPRQHRPAQRPRRAASRSGTRRPPRRWPWPSWRSASCSPIPNHLIEAHNAMKLEGKFLKKELKRTELYQKTLGLVGIGRIASEVAKRAAAFGMRVLAYDPYVKHSDVAILVPSLKELLLTPVLMTENLLYGARAWFPT